MSCYAAAGELGKKYERVRLWDCGETTPRKREIEEVFVWSQGRVRPDDWYDLPLLTTSRPATTAIARAAVA